MTSSYHSKVKSTQNKGVTFFLFGAWTLVLYPHVWVEPKFLLVTLTWQTYSMSNICMKTFNKLYVFLTGFVWKG